MKKIFKTRDSATALLRKMGVDRTAYSKFIIDVNRNGATFYEVNVKCAEASLTPPAARISSASKKENKEVTTGHTSGKKPAKLNVAKVDTLPKKFDWSTLGKTSYTPPAPLKPKQTRVSISSVARDMVIAGKTDAEILVVLQRDWDLPDSKKHYPKWYRGDCIRKGLI